MRVVTSIGYMMRVVTSIDCRMRVLTTVWAVGFIIYVCAFYTLFNAVILDVFVGINTDSRSSESRCFSTQSSVAVFTSLL